MNAPDSEVWKGILGGFSALGMVISVMWVALKRDHRRLERRADDSEKDLKRANKRLLAQQRSLGSLKVKVRLFESCAHVECPFKFSRRARKDLPFTPRQRASDQQDQQL